MLQGVPLSHLGGQLAIITGWLVVCFFTALKLFRWRCSRGFLGGKNPAKKSDSMPHSRACGVLARMTTP
jgi:hypothetical protein